MLDQATVGKNLGHPGFDKEAPSWRLVGERAAQQPPMMHGKRHRLADLQLQIVEQLGKNCLLGSEEPKNRLPMTVD